MRKQGFITAAIILVLTVAFIAYSSPLFAKASKSGKIKSKRKYRYAVIVSEDTYKKADWKKVATTLVEKHRGKLFQYPEDDLMSISPRVGKYRPDYMAFVATPEEAPRAFVNKVHRFARELDDDPYTDAIWGIVTGYTPENALKVAQYDKPMTIKCATGTFTGWLGQIKGGKCFGDGQHTVKNNETKWKVVKNEKSPMDATKLFVDEINKNKYDVVWTSSHATERIFCGFRHNKATGKIVPKNGRLIGIDLEGNRHPITTTNPKIYYAAGNCLIGHIIDRECMALAWINSGAYQFFGYLVPTGYGYQGWGLASFFFAQNDRFTYAESYFLNTQTMLYDLRNRTSGVMFGKWGLDRYKDNTVFYGDPAWEVRLGNVDPPHARLFETNLEIKKIKGKKCEVTFTVEFNADVKITNRTTSGNRPAAVFFPTRFENIKDVKNNFKLLANKIVVTDNFMLVDFWGGEEEDNVIKKGQKIVVSFTADKTR